MDNDQKSEAGLIDLGPLAGLVGTWEGNHETDISPGHPDRMMTDTETSYRERWVLELVNPAVGNHDQKLRQLTCTTTHGGATHRRQASMPGRRSMGSSVT